MTVRINDILDKLCSYAPDAEQELVLRAYLFAANAHHGQLRRSGEAYLVHPLEVADILADLGMDVDTLATALLHDTVEDTLVTREELAANFGEEIAELVDGVTKIGKLHFRSAVEAQAENFRKMVLAMSRDLRVVLVKLADRLHNMRTLEHMPPEKQQRIARETLEIYAPIANRLGLGKIKEELETLCFRYLQPEMFRAIVEGLAMGQAEREAYIARNTALLAEQLRSKGIRCEVTGRAKAPYSIYRKMVQKKLEFSQVRDLLAFRVFVDTVADCYAALGYVHAAFCPVPGEFDDYIAMPKANGYQSLHTAVLGPENQQIEVQVRTWEMHRVAEHGIAAHWRYKEGHLALKQSDLQRFARLRELFETAREVEDPTEFLQTVKVDLFPDEVYVFTPKREVKVLPRGATVLDFAYAIHTEVGHSCVGARVNDRIVPLKYELRTGDRVEILTRAGHRPNRDWLRIARTGRALAKIRRALREQEREQGVQLGRGMLAAELKRHGRNLARLQRDGRLKEAVKELGYREPEELYLALARGQLGLARALRALVPELEEEERPRPPSGLAALTSRLLPRRQEAVLIDGQSDVLVTYARCCRPLPGEPVVGFVTRGRGITVHRADCPQLLASEPGRRIPVEWAPGVKASLPSELRITCVDRPGLLSNVASCCEDLGINIGRAAASPVEDRKALIRLEVQVDDIAQLRRLLRNLEKVRGVISVVRGGG